MWDEGEGWDQQGKTSQENIKHELSPEGQREAPHVGTEKKGSSGSRSNMRKWQKGRENLAECKKCKKSRLEFGLGRRAVGGRWEGEGVHVK